MEEILLASSSPPNFALKLHAARLGFGGRADGRAASFGASVAASRVGMRALPARTPSPRASATRPAKREAADVQDVFSWNQRKCV